MKCIFALWWAVAAFGATEPEHSLYLVGEVRSLSATGASLGSEVYLIKRRVIPAESRVEIRSLRLSADGRVSEALTLMQVEGNEYTVTDPGKTYVGRGRWEGTPWHWTRWEYEAKLTNGTGSLAGEDTLGESQHRLQKRYYDRDGKLTRTVSGELSFVSAGAFEILARKLLP